MNQIKNNLKRWENNILKKKESMAKVLQQRTRGEEREIEEKPRPLISGYLNY